MQCPKCNNEVPQNAKYCPQCGTSLEKKCSKCGHIVSANDRYCAYCGNELRVEERMEGYYIPINSIKEQPSNEFLNDIDDFSYDIETYDEVETNDTYEDLYQDMKKDDKVKWKSIIIGLLVLLFLSTGSFMYLMANDDYKQPTDQIQQNQPLTPQAGGNEYSTYVGNVNMEGLAIFYQDSVYMTDSKGHLVSFDKEFNESKVLLDEAVSYITPYQDKIYFADSHNYLSVIDKDGKNKEVIIQKEVYYLVLKDDQLYYQLDSDQESLYVLDLKTKESVKLNDCRSYNPNITDKSIYYSSSDGIYVMNKDGSDDRRIVDGKVYNLIHEDGKLYYIQDLTLTIYDITTGELEQINNLTTSLYNKSGNMIYAFTVRGLVSYNLETKETKTLYAGNVDSFQVIGDVVLVKYNNVWTVIGNDGNQFQLFEEQSGDFI